MAMKSINAEMFAKMFLAGAKNLESKKEWINELNVFPVPDGDTGTNMAKTIGGGVETVTPEGKDVSSFMKQFSKAVLLSARGNSGVILSQFIRGIANGTEGKETLATADFPEIFHQGVICAYGAVSNPVEGTILTVMRETYEGIKETSYSDFISLYNEIVHNMRVSLQHTPDKLPVLKEAGVVDSGGMGLLYIIEGMLAYLNGDIIETNDVRDTIELSPANFDFGPDSRLEYGYCTEFVLQLMNYKTNIASFSVKDAISYLETIGDSIVAVQDEDIIKFHIHTFTPEKVLAYARTYGEFISVKIENMSLQHNETVENKKESEKIKYAVVTVASGDGIKDYFNEIGAHRIIDGGQTQNPSAQDFLDAFSTINAEHIVVLPNNSNIIMTAMQAAEIYTDADVRIIPTKSIPEGYSALSMMNTWANDIESFISDMESPLSTITTLNITQAVSDAFMDGVEVKKGMYIHYLEPLSKDISLRDE